jgi:hypothetical protein
MSEEAIYLKYLARLKAKLIVKYDELGLRASGDYASELEAQATDKKMIMLGAFHSQFMEHGRSAGGWPPRQAIENWIETKKGLPSVFLEKKKQFAFLIARKIAREGIQVPNSKNVGGVISKVVEDFLGDDIHEMIEELGTLWIPRIKSDIVEIFKQAA